MPKRLICTVGLPRSGKSTWAKTQPYPMVNPDSIRLALHGRDFEPLAEQFVWAIARVMVRALFTAGHDTVVLDATNVTRKRRDEWQNPREWETVFRVFQTELDVCMSRASDTLKPVIGRMADLWESLEPDEVVFQP